MPDENAKPDPAAQPADPTEVAAPQFAEAADGAPVEAAAAPAADALAEPRVALATLFQQAGVQSIIFIDDEFAVDHASNPPSAYFEAIESDDIERLPGFSQIQAGLPNDVLLQKCKEVWPTLQQAERTALYPKLRAVAEARGVEPAGAEKLARILEAATGLHVTRLSWAEWREQQGQLMATRFDGKFTMLLIDQDFSKEAGDPRGGIEILRALQTTIPAAEAGGLRCALLTNTKHPGEEHGAWDTVATEEKGRNRSPALT